MKGRFSAGVPVCCYVPAKDIRSMYQMSGDPSLTGVVSESTPTDIGKFCAALISSLNSDERRQALRIAQASLTREKLDVVPIPSLMPEDADVKAISRAINGLFTMLLALGSASGDTSVGTVMANAASMASGVPMASDPAAAERQNEVLLAKAIIEAALLGSEDAQEWFRVNGLSEALERCALAAKRGSTDSVPYLDQGEKVMKALYDCYKHDLPLGGDVVLGGSVKSFLSGLWDSTKKGVTSAIKEAAANAISKEVGKDGVKSDATENADAVQEVSEVVSSGTDAIQRQMDEVRSAIDAAKARLDQGQNSVADYKEKLRTAALQMARLQWAEEMLSAPDDVAVILSAVTPNLKDPGTFLQSMLSTLPAAKETGNLGTIKALVYALRSAVSKGDGSASSLYSLITGDPEQVVTETDMEGDGVSSSIATALRLSKTVSSEFSADAHDGEPSGEPNIEQ